MANLSLRVLVSLQDACTTLKDMALLWDSEHFDVHTQHHHGKKRMNDLATGRSFRLMHRRGGCYTALIMRHKHPYTLRIRHAPFSRHNKRFDPLTSYCVLSHHHHHFHTPSFAPGRPELPCQSLTRRGSQPHRGLGRDNENDLPRDCHQR